MITFSLCQPHKLPAQSIPLWRGTLIQLNFTTPSPTLCFCEFSLTLFFCFKSISQGFRGWGFAVEKLKSNIITNGVGRFTVTWISLCLEKGTVHSGEKLYMCSVDKTSTNHLAFWNIIAVTTARWHGHVGTVGRNVITHHSWKLIDAVTQGRSHSPAPSVGKDLLTHPPCWHTSKFTLRRGRSPALCVGRDSISHPT